MSPEIVAAIREVQEANLKSNAAMFNLREAEKVVESCLAEVTETDKLRRDAEHKLIKLVRGEST